MLGAEGFGLAPAPALLDAAVVGMLISDVGPYFGASWYFDGFRQRLADKRLGLDKDSTGLETRFRSYSFKKMVGVMIGENSTTQPSVMRQIHRFDSFTGWDALRDEVANELLVTVYVDGKERITLSCSPWDVETLVVGYLYAQEIIDSRDDLAKIEVDIDRGVAYVELSEAGSRQPVRGSNLADLRDIRSLSGMSEPKEALKSIDDGVVVSPQTVLSHMQTVLTHSDVFQKTGGVHGAVLADGDQILYCHEDIGRNNVLDRMMGRCLLDGVDMGDKVVAFSGRVSSEIVSKIVRMGVPVFISHSAPTMLAVDLAERQGFTLIAFARGGRFNVYAHPERLAGLGSGA